MKLPESKESGLEGRVDGRQREAYPVCCCVWFSFQGWRLSCTSYAPATFMGWGENLACREGTDRHLVETKPPEPQTEDMFSPWGQVAGWEMGAGVEGREGDKGLKMEG